MRSEHLAWLLLWALPSCGHEERSPAKPSADACADSTVTWETFADGFFRTWCSGCHAATQVGDERHDAPEGVDFDTYTSAVALAPLIRLAATGEMAYMPPTGGVSATDRALLLEWLDCGTPGAPTDAEVACEALPATPSSVIVDQADADALCAGGPVRVAGDLELRGDVVVDCVCGVTGTLAVDGVVAARALRTAGAVEVAPGSAVDLPELMDVAGSLTISDLAAADLSLPQLRTVAGELLLAGNPGLETLSLPRLERVDGDLVLADDPLLVDIGDLLAVETVGGVARFTRTGLIDADPLRFATSLNAATIADNADLLRIGGPELTNELPGDLIVRDNPALQVLGGWDTLIHLAGDLRIERNGALTTLLGFHHLDAIDGDVIIVDNPSLPRAEIEELLDGVTISGAIAITGNAP